MNCPACHAPHARVDGTIDHGALVERLRRCRICGCRFRTHEQEAAIPAPPDRPRKEKPK